MQEKEGSRQAKHQIRSFEDFEKEGRLEGVGRGRGYHGPWCPPRAGLDRDADGWVERALPYESGGKCS